MVQHWKNWDESCYLLYCILFLTIPVLQRCTYAVHPKGDQSWVFIGRTDAEAETPILWPPHAKSWLIGKDPDAGRDWGAGGEGDNRGWDGWMASPTLCTWVWVNSGSWWWTGRPGVLQFTWLRRVGHDWATELNWINSKWIKYYLYIKVIGFMKILLRILLFNRLNGMTEYNTLDKTWKGIKVNSVQIELNLIGVGRILSSEVSVPD